jgi:hypothetical protein
MDGQIKSIPVTYNGVIVGHSEDEGKTIHFHSSEEAKKVMNLLNSKQTIWVSSRGTGKVNEDGIIKEHEVHSYSVGHFNQYPNEHN